MEKYLGNMKGIFLACLFGAALFFVGCSKDHDNGPAPDVSGLMVFNLIPDQPSVGFTLSNSSLGSAMSFLGYSGGYLSIVSGSRRADVFSGESGDSLTSATETFLSNKYYSLFAIGKEGAYKSVMVDDGLDTTNASEGHAYVRFFNSVSGLDDDLKVEITNADGELFNGDAAYGEASPFVESATGDITIKVLENGEELGDRTIKLEELKAYTILVADAGTEDGEGAKIQIKYIENGTLTLEDPADNNNEGGN